MRVVRRAVGSAPGGRSTIACDCVADVAAAGRRACICSRSRAASCLRRGAAGLHARRCRPSASARPAPAAASFDLADALAEGDAAGRGAAAAPVAARQRGRAVERRAGRGWRHRSARRRIVACGDRRAKAFVDFQNDVTAQATSRSRCARACARSSTSSATPRPAWRPIRARLSNMNALGHRRRGARQADRRGRADDLPPALYAGDLRRLRRPRARRSVRSGPQHADARLGGASSGAVFEDVGLWKRACYFPQRRREHARGGGARMPRDRAPASACSMPRRSARSRSSARTPRTFSNRMYANAFAKLDVGRCRYGLMLREDGFVIDDGVVARLAADRFHVTTTTGGAPRVLAHDGGLSADRMAGSRRSGSPRPPSNGR